MNPIFRAVDSLETLLGHSPHPAIVAVPIGAWTVSNVCDVLGLVTGARTYDHAAQISMGIGLLGAAGAAITGYRDYTAIPEARPSHETATRHAVGNAVAGTLFLASYLLRQRTARGDCDTPALARFLGLAGGGLMLYTSWLGGKLVQEQGEAVKPVMDRLSQQEQTAGDERQRSRPFEVSVPAVHPV